ncbi:hypothetical protein [Aquabacterium sp.]|uniref:hypothetical protein n=1 Tax=Aquabacterium sp. TaxID=1872578 RepID=UPI0035B0FC9D
MSTQSPLWQDLLAIAIALGAFAYLGRRWWPAWRAAFRGRAQTAAGSHCATTDSSASCGSGCGRCGQSQDTPSKDHRVHVTPRA